VSPVATQSLWTRGLRGAPTAWSVGFAVLCVFGLLSASPASATAVVEGPQSDKTSITCKVDENGTTTCAVTLGSAAVCSLRKGQDIKRSYRAYDYLNDPPGCTLDIEYWRKHAPGGSANYDETWERVGAKGPSTEFFGSKRSFAETLGSAVKDEDAYLTLARAYVAAELNRLNGAKLPEPVRAADDEASVLLLASPGGKLDAKTAARGQTLAAILNDFVSGRTGAGSCRAMTNPIGPQDIGKKLTGDQSDNSGTITALEETKNKPGEGLLTINPLGPKDQFLLADEPFTIEGIRKGRFTPDVNDCATVDAGEETTVAVGGTPSDPVPISALMQQLARNLLVMIALNSQSQTAAPAPSAGPGGPVSGGPAGGGGGGAAGGAGGGGFPSAVLPGLGAGSGGSDLIPVPNLIGLTETQARGRISSAGLSVGNVTTVSSLYPSDFGLVSSAYAQTPTNPPVVVGQSPQPGFLCTPGCPIDFQLSSTSEAMPEPSSLSMIVVALAALGLLLWRGRRRDISGAALILLVLALSGCENPAPQERIGLAKQYLDSGRPNGAVIELKKALQEEPGNFEARFLLGNAYLGLGRLSDAEKEFNRALTLKPGEPGSTLALALIWLREGNAARLLMKLQPQPAWTNAERARAWTLRGQAEFAGGDLETAKHSFESAVALDTSDVQALIGLAQIAGRSNDEGDVTAILNRALAVAPADPIILTLAGQRAFSSGSYAEAESTFRRQLAAAPDSFAGRLGLAQALLAQNRDPEAVAELDRVLAQAPDHPDALYLSAVVNLRRGQFKLAGQMATAALRVRPQHQPSRAVAAIAAAQLGNWLEARTQLDALKALDPDHPLLAELSGRVDRALAESKEQPAAVQARPIGMDLALFRLDPAGVPGLEEILARLERGDANAWLEFQRSLVSAANPWPARGRAFAEYRLGHSHVARLVLQAWLNDHPDDVDTRAVLAELSLAEGDQESAFPQLLQLASERPRDARVLNNLAWIFAQRGDLGRARIYAERAVALAPEDPRIVDTRGLILLQAGDVQGSVAMLKRAAGNEAAPSEVRIHLAQALIQSGDSASARAVLTQTLADPMAADQHRAATLLLQKLQP
jgi:Tfp pilus assembly protein PilF